jgi:hypothetical protein
MRTGTGIDFVCQNAGSTFISSSIGGVSTTGVASGCAVGSGAANGTSGNKYVVGYLAADPTARFVGGALLGAPISLTAGRDSVSTPGFNVWDLGFFKNTYVTEQGHFQFRVELYNAFNHRNFSLNIPTVLTVLDPGNALVTGYANVTSGSSFLNSHQFSGGNRIIQLGLKYIW